MASPCDRPPATPTGVKVIARAIEAKTHLNFKGRIVWDDVTEDTSGFHINTVDRFEVQWRAVDSDGDPVEVEHTALRAVTNPTGDTYRLKTDRATGDWNVGDQVKIRGCFPETDYNGTWKIINRIDLFTFEVKGNINPLQDAKRPGEVYNQSTKESFRRMVRNPQPKAALRKAQFVVLDSNHFNVTSVTNPSGTTYRVNTGPVNNYQVGDYIHLQNISPAKYNGVWKVTSIVDTDTFQVLGDTSGLAAGGAGDVYTATAGFRYTTREASGFSVGQQVRVEGNRPETDYNGTWPISNVSIQDNTFDVKPNRNPDNPLIDAEVVGTAYNEDDSLHVLIPHFPRPKTWSWQARVRARSGEGCWSSFSDWTNPLLPWEGADPLPPTPTYGFTPITFDTKGKGRDSKVRLLFTFDEVVHWDVPGGDHEDDMRAYAIQLDRSDDGVTWDGGPTRTHHRPSKDNDADTTITAVFHNIRRRYWYRCRVRSIDRFSRHGDWSAWTPAALPFDDNRPPAPTNVETWSKGTDRVPIRWDDPLVDVPIRGVSSVINGSATVTGTGTKYNTEVRDGTLLRFAGSTTTYNVKQVISDTSLILEGTYSESSGTKSTFLQEDDPDVAFYEWQIAKNTQVTNGTPDIFNHIYDHGRTRGNNVSVKVEPGDENLKFRARVRSIDAAHNRSPWISAWIRANHGGFANNSSTVTGDDGGIDQTVSSDGVPPATSPSANAAGYVGYIAAWWTAVGNADPINYEVHISTTSGFSTSAGTLLASTPGLSAVLTRYADGSPLIPGTNYYVKVVARDQDGAAASGAQAGPVTVKAQVSDGVPPSLSPAPFVIGSGDFIKAVWIGISNADPVSYEVHVGTVAGFTPTSATLFAVTDATTIMITRAPPMTGGGSRLVPGTTYFVKLIARDYDGAAAVGTEASAVAPGQVSDGSAPQQSPAVTQVLGGVGFLSVRWLPLTYGPRSATANPDPVTYEVHMSLTDPPVGDATTKVGETTGSAFFIKRTAAGVDLTYGTTYFVGLRARDADGIAAMGATLSGKLVPATGGDIAVGAVSADKILAGAITADKLTSNLAVSGRIVAANDQVNWQNVTRIEIDGQQGLRLILDDGVTENVLVSFPLDGNGPSFKGGIDADSIAATGPITFKSALNTMEPGAAITMSGAIPPPAAAPSVRATWPTLQFPGGQVGDPYTGLSYSASGGSGGALGVFYSVHMDVSTGGDWVIGEYNAAVGNLNRSLTYLLGNYRGDLRVLGACQGSTFIYVLYYEGGGYKIARHNRSNLALVDINEGVDGQVNNLRPGIFWDGTNLCLVTTATGGGSSRIRLRKYSFDLVGLTNQDLDVSIGVNASHTRTGGGVLATNSGQTLYYVTIRDNSANLPNSVVAFNPTTGLEPTYNRFGDGSGVAPDAITYNPNDGFFYSLPSGSEGEYHRHSDAYGLTDATNKVWWGVSWRDSDATGGLHETTLSPRLGTVWSRRSFAQVTWQTPPTDRGGTDDVDSTRVYAVQSATDPGAALASYWRQATVNSPASTTTLAALSTATAGVAGTAFPNVTNPGKLLSASGRTVLAGDDTFKSPVFALRCYRAGDNNLTIGTVFLWTPAQVDFENLPPGFAAGALGGPNNPANAGANTMDFVVPTGWGGVWRLLVQLRFAAGDTSGKTQVDITKNASQTAGGGTLMARSQRAGSNNAQTQTTEYVGVLAAGDYLEVNALTTGFARDLIGTTSAPGESFALWMYLGD
jgi:hypothetical protein